MKEIFNKTAVTNQRNRVALKTKAEDDFLHTRAAELLHERAEDIIKPGSIIINSGGRFGVLSQLINETIPEVTLYDSDLSIAMLRANKSGARKVVADEERMPYRAESADAVVSCLNLHWTNDVPGALVQYQKMLKPGGVFMGSLLGGASLHELKKAIARAAANNKIKMTPRVSPVIDTKTSGKLLQRAGFTDIVTDGSSIEVEYKTSYDLMKDLHAMGETNKLKEQQEGFISRSELGALIEEYDRIYQEKGQKIQATFEIITMIGWKSL